MNLADMYGDTPKQLEWHLSRMKETGIVDDYGEVPGQLSVMWQISIAGESFTMDMSELRHFIFGCMRITAKYLRPMASVLAEEQPGAVPYGDVPSGSVVRRVFLADATTQHGRPTAAVTLFEAADNELLKASQDDEMYWVVTETFHLDGRRKGGGTIACTGADYAVRLFNTQIDALGIPGKTKYPTGAPIRKP